MPGVAELSNLAGYVQGGFFWRFCAVILEHAASLFRVACVCVAHAGCAVGGAAQGPERLWRGLASGGAHVRQGS